MRIESLDCNKCGAPLDVPEKANFVRCGHCGSRLKVHRESSVHYTEVLGKIEKSTQRLEGDVRVLLLQNDVRELDEAWESLKKRLVVVDPYGRFHTPSRAAARMVLAGTGVLVLMMLGSAVSGAMSWELGLVLAMVSLGGFAWGGHLRSQADAYDRAEASYRARRRLLKHRMGEARRAGLEEGGIE